jgi:hypothetical protein
MDEYEKHGLPVDCMYCMHCRLKEYCKEQDNNKDKVERSSRVMSPMLQKWIATVRRDFVHYYKNDSNDHKKNSSIAKKKNTLQRMQQLEDLTLILHIRDVKWEEHYQIVKQYYDFI